MPTSRQEDLAPQEQEDLVISPNRARELVALAEQSAAGGVKVLPGKEWAFHYSISPPEKAAKLEALARGEEDVEVVAESIRPDALIYDVRDLARDGLGEVSARIREQTELIRSLDIEQLAHFVHELSGTGVSTQEAENIYREIARSRVQSGALEAYGRTGRQQIEKAVKSEIAASKTGFSLENQDLSKVLGALKADWAFRELGVISEQDRDEVVTNLSGGERELLGQIQNKYTEYVKKGGEDEYQELASAVRESLPKVQQKQAAPGPSESMAELEESLEPLIDQVGPPGSPEDTAIPPDDSDEYHTAPAPEEGSVEKALSPPIFQIDPPLKGYYASGRKSYFDTGSKTWSKKKQVTPYETEVSGDDRSTISGQLDKGLKSLPLPNGYTLDAASLEVEGSIISLLRDQNGCFYLNSDGPATFSVDFMREAKVFTGAPIHEDKENIIGSSLSEATEATIGRVKGSPLQVAESVRQHILANHFYPGGGDLTKAQALQHKLRIDSESDDYLSNLDQSEYLECYSANTLFVAIMRRLGVPARLVVGHRVERVKDGKAVIDRQTGHAWAEIWDGSAWRRFDATPPPKPEDRTEEQEEQSELSDSDAPEAEDEGVEGPPQEGGEDQGQVSEMSEASDEELQDANDKLQEAQSEMDRINEARSRLEEKMQNVDSFSDVEEVKDDIAESDLDEVTEESLREKLEAIEEQMISEVKDQLDDMAEDGFLDEDREEELRKQLEESNTGELDALKQVLDREFKLYQEYEEIRADIEPYVRSWFKFFVERLPRESDIEVDEDTLSRQGAFNRRSVKKYRNLALGTIKNPREFRPSVKPKFLASILIDVSGSMMGEKLKGALKLLVFYSELFDLISKEFGYIRFSIHTFSDFVTKIKDFDQDYSSSERYDFGDGKRSTIKVRLMEKVSSEGGTNMLDAVRESAKGLSEESRDYPDYVSAFYFVGDGEDTRGNSENIRRFLASSEEEGGFGEHLRSAILMGPESQRGELADIFGDEYTSVAPDFDRLIDRSMDQFTEDIEEYLEDKLR